MVLNNHAFIHKKIKVLCYRLEQLSGLKLVTNLSKQMKEIKFEGSFAHIIIDYRNNAIFVLNHKLIDQEIILIQDIMLYSNWLEIGEKYSHNFVTKM